MTAISEYWDSEDFARFGSFLLTGGMMSIDPQVFVLFGRVLQLFESLNREYAQMRRVYRLPSNSSPTQDSPESQHKDAKPFRGHGTLDPQSRRVLGFP